ncbi:hypothetical protein CICLE_v10010500mg, partial [Citrus x clementina]
PSRATTKQTNRRPQTAPTGHHLKHTANHAADDTNRTRLDRRPASTTSSRPTTSSRQLQQPRESRLVDDMDPEAARTARESLDLAFHMSNILDTGLDRHTLSILIALCDLGVNPEALAAVVKELQQEPSPSPPMSTAPSSIP